MATKRERPPEATNAYAARTRANLRQMVPVPKVDEDTVLRATMQGYRQGLHAGPLARVQCAADKGWDGIGDCLGPLDKVTVRGGKQFKDELKRPAKEPPAADMAETPVEKAARKAKEATEARKRAEEKPKKVRVKKPKVEKAPKPPKPPKPKAPKPKAEKPKAEKPKAEKPKAEKPKAASKAAKTKAKTKAAKVSLRDLLGGATRDAAKELKS